MRALWQALFADLRVAKVPFFQGFAQHGTCIGPTGSARCTAATTARRAANAAILVAKSALSACSVSIAALAQLKPRSAIGRERRVISGYADDTRWDRDGAWNRAFRAAAAESPG